MKENDLNFLMTCLAKWMAGHDFPFKKTTKKVTKEDQKVRLALGLTFEKFANAIDISDSTVFKWEAKPDERLHQINEAAERVFFC